MVFAPMFLGFPFSVDVVAMALLRVFPDLRARRGLPFFGRRRGEHTGEAFEIGRTAFRTFAGRQKTATILIHSDQRLERVAAGTAAEVIERHAAQCNIKTWRSSTKARRLLHFL